MSKVLVLSYCNLNSAHSGGNRRAGALLEMLGDKAILIQPSPAHPDWETITYPRDLGRRKIGINWGIFNFYLPGAARLARNVIRKQPPAAILLTNVLEFHAIRQVQGIPLVLDAQNVESVALRERFGAQHPFTRIMSSWEGKVARQMDHIFACSARDRDGFVSLYGVPTARVSIVPNGVQIADFDRVPDTVRLDPQMERKLGAATVLFFMGKLDYQPNRVALAFLRDTLLPALEARRPGQFKVLICGGPVPSGSFPPSMIFAGRQPSVIPFLKRSDLCLAPIFSGSGTRLKVLEYLAGRRPVVSTPKGAEGLECESGRHLILAEPADFVRHLLTLADDPEKGRRLGLAGYAYVKERFDWNRIQSLWREALRKYVAL